MNTDILVPVSFFILIGVVVKFVLDRQVQKRRLWHETLQLALQKDYPLSEKSWQKFLQTVDPQRSDLRKGVLFMVLAAGLVLIGLLKPFQDGQGNRAILVLAIIPFMVALVYLAFWRFWYPSQE
ncbi:DUF6249 domain-containing protein [Bowmanella dokdonensis]|uniref:Uncharacterized protein n=1 Tax=Bowmanella dokdonensis TaxID=751969 RepID=A0A939IT99_9ALTE|nr:DUF6249 domain-containing protein [Bowmanella dokdonensis]MBN7827567.1 hypothetical protein [Bowmanella dokdonensis]